MDTLMGSCWKIFPRKLGEEDRLIWGPGDVSLSRKENGFPRNHKTGDVYQGFSLSASFRCKTVRFVSSVAPENQTLFESDESDKIPVADQLKTAHVRFKLTKECAFGQHFLIVGDDPCLGLWDPSDGVRFDWSDGHLWTAELDVPCGKMIKYKFILKVDDNTVLWQPGPDRVLETWETKKTIIVFEDWDHPEFQDITEEEELIADLNDEKSLMPSVSENLSETTQDEGTNVKKQLVGTNDHSSLDDKLKQDSNTNINDRKHEERSVLEQEAPVLLQDIAEEEELIADLSDEKSLINSELPTVSENLSKTTQDEGPDVKKQLVGTNDHSSLDDKLKQDINTNINDRKHEEVSVLEQEAPVLLHDIAVEEELIADLNDEMSLIESELPAVSKNFSKTTQDEGANVKRELVGANDHSSLDDKVKQDSNTNINDRKHEERSVLEQEAPVLLQGLVPLLTYQTDEESSDEVKDEGERSVLKQEAPVLFQRLIPMLTDETDEKCPNELKDEELKDEHNSASLRSTETSKVVMENEKGFNGKEQLEILEGGMQWGRGIVLKFLAILGFLILLLTVFAIKKPQFEVDFFNSML